MNRRGRLGERWFDIVLLDIELDGADGIEFTAETLSAHPDMRIVIVTAGRDESRETWIPPRLLTHVLAELKSAQSERAELAALLATLSPREKKSSVVSLPA